MHDEYCECRYCHNCLFFDGPWNSDGTRFCGESPCGHHHSVYDVERCGRTYVSDDYDELHPEDR